VFLVREKDIQAIAKGCDLSERAVRRFLGSVRVPRFETGENEPSRAEIGRDLGLRVDQAFRSGLAQEVLGALVSALNEYKKCCPLVVAWIARGDFRPKEIPAQINAATLLHASRTAGRLRALIMRGRTEMTAEQAPEEIEH
jgi:hypothetical protein